ncbi:MAG: ribosome maturation factor RimM, partial [Actinomycetota bacterium]
VRFVAVDDAAAAERLRGLYLFVPSSELGELGEGEYWEHQLVGLEVHHVDGTELGILTAVIDRPGQDLWSIDTAWGEVLFPAARELVEEVDLDRRIVIVDPPEGLF